jgi:2,3-bisphosphoglycerate-dependent phosphoglycerate mutase
MPDSQIYHIFLLRHAESTGNSKGLFQGHSDFELSEIGIKQAQRLALRWSTEGMNFDKIVSSPLLRARQTAEIISNALGTEIELQPTWMERDIGSYTGRPASEIADIFPQSPFEPVGQTGESQWDLYLRASHAIHNLFQHPPGRFLIVAHGGIINLAIYTALGIPPPPGPSGPRFILANAAFAELTYSPHEHAWRLYSLNDRQHLAETPKNQDNHNPVKLVSSHSKQERLYNNGYANNIRSLSQRQLPNYSIRPANPSDLDGILEVFTEVDYIHAQALPTIFRTASNIASNRNYFSSLLLDSNTRFFVADVNREIVGVLYASIHETSNSPLAVPRRHLKIIFLSVKPDFRRLGIGLALMNEAHSWAHELGLKTVELIVWEFNEGARRFYESLGYSTANRKMWIDLGDGA